MQHSHQQAPTRMAQRALLAFAVMAAGSINATAALAEDLRIASAAAVKTALADIPKWAAERRGDTIRFEFGTAGAVRERAVADPTIDVIIVPPAVQKDLARLGLIDGGSLTAIGTVTLGLAAAAGNPSVALGSLDDLRRVLLDAPSIGLADPAKGATSGIFLAKLMETLGIKDAVGSKLRYFPDGQAAMEAAARHEVALSMGQTSEAVPVSGLNPVVPLPDAAQLKTTYVAALSTHSLHPDAARQLLTLLGSPQAIDAFRRAGFAQAPAGQP